MNNETTAPVQSLADELLADLSRAEKTHLDCEVRDMAREAYRLIRQQQAALAKLAAPVAVPDDIRAQIEGPFNACMFKEHCCRAIAAPTPPAQQPVAWISVEEPFHGTAGIEAGEWDIQCDGKAIDELAAANSPGRIPLYAGPPAQQSQWVEVSERMPEETDDDGSVVIEAYLKTGKKIITSARYLRINKNDFSVWRLLPTTPGDTAAPEQAEPQECGCCGKPQNPRTSKTQALHLNAEQLSLMDSALGAVIAQLSAQAYHHSRRGDKHYQADARNCHATTARYRGLREHIKAWRDGQQECGCCGQAGPCDPDCDCVVTVPRELAERISIAESQGDGPALHEAIDELRALLEGGK